MKFAVEAMLALALSVPLGAVAGEVIAHPSVRIDPADVRDVYLGERQLAGDLRLMPADNLAAHEHFLAAILQTTVRSYEARWKRKTFREGLPPPPMKGSDAEVMSYVRSTPGAIGYLAGTAGPGVIVLDRF
jgi:hypothetical protein